jgi:hypothetical protein
MLNNALVMREAEPAYYGRVMSLTMLAWGANGIAGLPFGVLADCVGERATVLAMAAAVVATTAAAAGAAGTIGRREPALAAVPLSEPREERSL